jgi:hypothetical protein
MLLNQSLESSPRLRSDAVTRLWKCNPFSMGTHWQFSLWSLFQGFCCPVSSYFTKSVRVLLTQHPQYQFGHQFHAHRVYLRSLFTATVTLEFVPTIEDGTWECLAIFCPVPCTLDPTLCPAVNLISLRISLLLQLLSPPSTSTPQ